MVCRNGSFHLRGNVYVHYKSLESACLAYNSMNGRYFAGKQIICEFIGVTRWKIAICGEYMKSRLKTCSRGTTCNFIHCFRNPGGDYEWADWDNLPPKHWMKKMIALFGHSHDLETPNHMDLENMEPQKRTRTSERVHSGSCHAVSEKDESVHHGEHPSISVEQDKLSRKHSSFCHEQDHFGDEGYTSIYHSKRRCSSRKTCYIQSGSVDREVDLNEEEKKAGDNSHEGKRYRKHKRDRSYSQTRKEHKHGKDGSSYYHERYHSHDGSLDCDYDRHYEDVCVVTGLISHPPENALSQTATGDDTTNTSHHGFAECKAKKVASFRSSSGDLAGESNKCIKHDLQKHSSNNSDQDVDRRYQKHMVSDQSVSSGESISYKKDRRNKSKKRSLGDSQSSYNNDWSEVKESVVSSRKSSENHRGRRRRSSCNDGTKREYQRKKKPKNDEREDGQEDSASSDPGSRKNRKRSSRETSMERSGGSKRR